PPLSRTPMAPASWPPRLLFWQRVCAAARGDWHRAGALRRIGLLALTLSQAAVGTYALREILPYHGGEALEVSVLVLFALLFFWVSAGFWTALMGFVLLASGRDRHAITRDVRPDAPISEHARTAIVMPICNEDVDSVFGGLRATYESLERAGVLRHFDFFVLS